MIVLHSGSNNTGSNNTSGSILGTWEIQSTTQTGVSGYLDPILGTEIETDSYTDINTSNDTVKSYLVYRYDNTHTYYHYFLDTLQFESDYTYVKNGDEVIIDSSWSYTVTTLTNNNLSFYWDDNWTDVWNDTTFFENSHNVYQCVKSELPSITTETLNKKKPVSGYDSFLNRRRNR
jgi:hypothetical protein